MAQAHTAAAEVAPAREDHPGEAALATASSILFKDRSP